MYAGYFLYLKSSGVTITKQLETELMPGAALITWNAALDHVCGAEHRAAHNAVYVAAFQRYARIEHVVCRDDVESLLFGHAFCFAKFVKSVCILCSVLACLGIVKGYARKIYFGEFGFDFLFVADENDFANVL